MDGRVAELGETRWIRRGGPKSTVLNVGASDLDRCAALERTHLAADFTPTDLIAMMQSARRRQEGLSMAIVMEQPPLTTAGHTSRLWALGRTSMLRMDIAIRSAATHS